jgi:hypothetical protein
MTITRLIVTTGMLTVVVAASPSAHVQQPPPEPPPVLRIVQVAPGTTIEGELVRVDTVARKLVVKTATGEEEELHYTLRTTVDGVASGLPGLAAATGMHATVTYKGTGRNRIATGIAVQEAKR